MKSNFIAATAEIANLRELDLSAESASPFAALGYKPDPSKAYIEFDICQSLPAVAGPVQSGNYVGYFADTLAASHGSLVHQQFNIRHMVKAYAGPVKPGEQPSIARDRIIGAVVATHFPKPPMGNGWLKPGATTGAAACIRACAVVFKLAEGVPALLGQHLASRVKQSVSIECITSQDNIGIWIPSKGELMPYNDPSDEVIGAMSLNDPQGKPYPGLCNVGMLNGEQLVVVYGLNGQAIHMRGVGMTPRPAERTAKIVSVAAEKDDGELFAMAAETVNEELVGQEVRFRSGRRGKILFAKMDGEARLNGLRLKGTPEDPALTILLPDGARILKPLSGILEKIS